MQAALSSPHRSAPEARRASADPRRSRRTVPPGVRPSASPRPSSRQRRGDAVRRRFAAGSIVVFAVMLAIAAFTLFAWHDSPATLAVVVPLVATYLASSAWLALTVVLLRSARGPVLNAWACGGAVLLVASFVAQVVVERGG